MKRFLLLVCLFLASACGSHAAAPTLTNFNPRHFLVNQHAVPTNVILLNIPFGPGSTNLAGDILSLVGTNNATVPGVIIINTNVTILTNLYITTNTYITVVGNTNLAGLWTDTLGDYTPTQADQSSLHATNIIGVTSLVADDKFIMSPIPLMTDLNPGENDLVIFKSVLQCNGTTPNPVDSWIRLNWTSFGQFLVVENFGTNAFTMFNGDPLWTDATKNLYLKGGDWTPTNNGESILLLSTQLGWAEIGRFGGPTNVVTGDLWQVVGGTNLQPVDLTWRPTTQLGWTVGTNTSAHWSGGMTNGEALVSSRNVDLGERNNNEIFIETRGATNIASVDINTKTNLSYIDQVVTIGSANYEISNVVLGTDTDSQWIWGGYTVTDIHPTAPDGTAPYLFSTSTNHTTGNLVEVKSGVPPVTTNAFTLAANSGFTGTGTKALTDDGTYKIVGGIGTGDLWTNNAGILEPVNLALPVEIDSQLRFGPGATNVLSRYGDRSLLYTNSATSAQGSVNIEVKNGNGVDTGITANDGLGTVQTTAAQLGLQANGVQVNVGQGANSFFPSVGTTKLGYSGGEWNSLYLTNQIVWGPGTTNVVYRSGNDLVYTNNSTDTKFVVANTSGTFLSLEAQSLTGFLSAAGSANAVGLRQGTNQVLLSGGVFSPIPDSSQSLGSQSERWLNYAISGTGYTYGYLTNSTNYSLLSVHHTGTNGVGAGIILESQANGGGGSPRPFVFTNAPVQLPWFTSLQKTNLAEVANGMLIYQTDNTPGLRCYVNGAWVILQTAADP